MGIHGHSKQRILSESMLITPVRITQTWEFIKIYMFLKGNFKAFHETSRTLSGNKPLITKNKRWAYLGKENSWSTNAESICDLGGHIKIFSLKPNIFCSWEETDHSAELSFFCTKHISETHPSPCCLCYSPFCFVCLLSCSCSVLSTFVTPQVVTCRAPLSWGVA